MPMCLEPVAARVSSYCRGDYCGLDTLGLATIVQRLGR